MSLKEPKYITYIENFFSENSADYNEILQKVKADDKNKLLVNTHFYYFICQPDKNEDEVRSELRIVGITSLIESMMQEVDYKDFFAYFESKYKKQNKIEDYNKLKEEYLKEHGSAKKIRKYFEECISDDDQKIMIDGIEKYNKVNYLESEVGKKLIDGFKELMNNNNIYEASKIRDEIDRNDNSFVKLLNKDELAKFFNQMRSDFVHKAEMRGFCSASNDALLMPVGKESYNIEIDIKVILKIFERSFVKFWKNKISQ